MNLTAIIDNYSNASAGTRAFVSITIAILVYAGFRYLIYLFNKNAQEIPEKKNDWKENLKSLASQN